MAFRLAAAALVFAYAGLAGAQAQIRKESELHARLSATPLLFYLARGEENACGPGCREWIAVEGQFDKGSAKRFAAFVKSANARHLPVFFESTGGLTDEAIELGRFLRSEGMQAGVATTRPECPSEDRKACLKSKAIKPDTAVEAAWSRQNARCSSACLFALIGAAERRMPAEGSLGIHSTVYLCFDDGRPIRPVGKSKKAGQCREQIATRMAQLSRYIRDMGIDAGLLDAASKVPNTQIRFLTRDEIARFGIARDEAHKSE